MKVLIAGAGGQVGQALVASAPQTVAVVPMTHATLDITDKSAVTEAVAQERPDIAINAAAYTAVDRAETEAERARAVNETGARNFAEAALRTGSRLIHISTDFVFDGESSVPYRTDAIPSPLNVYGATKLAGEQAVLETLPLRAIVLRTAWVYSSKGRNFLTTMLRLMRDNATVRVVSDQHGSPTSADSVATVIWALCATPSSHGIFHWTDSGITSWYEFAVAIAEEAATAGLLPDPAAVLAIDTGEYPTAAKRPRYSALDSGETVRATGISPPHWRESLKCVLADARGV